MATQSSVLAWRIPGTGVPGGLPSMGSHRVGHDWNDLAAAATKHHRNKDKGSKGTELSIVRQNVPFLEGACKAQAHRNGDRWPLTVGNGEGDGDRLQYSCLENPMDGGAWWAALHGVTQSRTQLKRLSSSSNSRKKAWIHLKCTVANMKRYYPTLKKF